MSDIRKERAYDGRCTIFAGNGLIISDLSDETADLVVAHLSGTSAPTRGVRNVGGRGLKSSSDLKSARNPGRKAG